MSTSIYSYTSTQSEMVRFYDLYRNSVMSARYHSRKLKRVRLQIAIIETVSAFSASSAVASLAIWKTNAGGGAFTALLAISAVAALLRSSFRLSDHLDRHSRLAAAWHELALDMDRVIAAARRADSVTDTVRARLDDLCERFQRIEMSDSVEGEKHLIGHIQDEVDQSIPADRLWLPGE